MTKAFVLAVAVASFLSGAWLSPLLSASPQIEMVGDVPVKLEKGQRIYVWAQTNSTCDVIRHWNRWVECQASTYVNLESGVSFRITQ